MQNVTEIGQSAAELMPFLKQRPSAILNFKNIHIWSWLSSSSKCAVVYDISSKSDDFSFRYGDFTSYNMAAVHQLEFSKFRYYVT